jgi:hypothetical protein
VPLLAGGAGVTALMLAAQSKSKQGYEIATMLLKAGADVEAQRETLCNALTTAEVRKRAREGGRAAKRERERERER